MVTEEQKQQLDAMFKFKIGDMVKTFGSVTAAADDDRHWTIGRELRFQVVERMIQQCPGGVQLHYVCSGRLENGDVTDKHFRFLEIELVASSPFETAKRD